MFCLRLENYNENLNKSQKLNQMSEKTVFFYVTSKTASVSPVRFEPSNTTDTIVLIW